MPSVLKLAAFAVAVFLVFACLFAASRPWWANVVNHVETHRLLADQQARVARAHAADLAIHTAIARALAQVPFATRVRVGLIHQGDGAMPLRFDVTHIAAVPGASPGDFSVGRPLSQWESYMGKFLLNQCTLVSLKDSTLADIVRARLLSLHVAASLGCPLTTPAGDLVGGVFLNWDDLNRVPDNPEQATAALREAAVTIAAFVTDLF